MRIVEYDRLAQRSCRGRAAEHWLSRGLLGAKYSPHTSGWVEYPSTIYGAQCVPTVSTMSCLPFCDWLVGEWIPAFAESAPRLGQKGSGGNDDSEDPFLSSS